MNSGPLLIPQATRQQPQAPSPLVQVSHLTLSYGSQIALEDASLSIRAGEFTAIIGPNGAGKSSLLKALVGLAAPSSGTITFAPELGRPQTAVAYVPQQQTLDWGFPVTVWDTAMMGRTARLGWGRWPGRADRERVSEALQKAGVYDLKDRHIGALSGGQRQRVLLARMLTRDARLLLLDEPLTGVDAATQERIMALLRVQADEGRAVVMVTHDLEAAAAACDHLVLVNRRVVAQGKPEVVYTPQNVEATFSSSHLGHTHAHA
ncbi:metal ABC transporter ATP-binding protein [Deinococcus detaillensis]|uniref:Metal ABC transporter ATP-binding protein n=1 Tax=Deinococcus detaillensis TaxID=2592048 RepID=A0A553URX8_9DEIO|nr:metal ABC transporter ATP-binding protein [Deinococcus detaillensis]TSA82977.1 metal ABC transporter ATP-binding protein [Deinococcus detaillensis]